MSKKSDLKKQYMRERKRIQNYINKNTKQGYKFDYTLPAIPKKITQSSINKLAKITPSKLKSKAQFYDIDLDTGEFTLIPASDVTKEIKQKYNTPAPVYDFSWDKLHNMYANWIAEKMYRDMAQVKGNYENTVDRLSNSFASIAVKLDEKYGGNAGDLFISNLNLPANLTPSDLIRAENEMRDVILQATEDSIQALKQMENEGFELDNYNEELRQEMADIQQEIMDSNMLWNLGYLNFDEYSV